MKKKLFILIIILFLVISLFYIFNVLFFKAQNKIGKKPSFKDIQTIENNINTLPITPNITRQP